MRISFFVATCGLLCAFTPAHGQGTVRITFDGPPEMPAGSSILVRNYSESGMSFRPITSSGDFGRIGGGVAPFPENGTAYLIADSLSSLAFGLTNNLLFDLLAVDLAEYSTTFQEPLSVRFVGYKPDGSSLNAVFVTDGIIDGTGPLADFETFYFGPQWSGLTRVEVPTYRWSLDNLVVSVPEPSAGALLFTAIALACARRLRVKRD